MQEILLILEIVLKELDTNNKNTPQTYTECNIDNESVVRNNLRYMKLNNIKVPLEMQQLPSFTGYLSSTKTHTVVGLLLPPIVVLLSIFRDYLHLVLIL